MKKDLLVHVVDDDAAIRLSLTMLLESAGYAARSHASAEEALAGIDPETAGCVVSDVRMPGMGGLELQGVLAERGVSAPVIVISGHADVPMAIRALKSGAVEFLEKPFDERDFLGAVDQALSRSREIRGELRSRAELEARAARLTRREREVMDMVTSGLVNTQIAARLGISVRTVETYRAAVMAKMDAAGLPDLVRMCLRLGSE